MPNFQGNEDLRKLGKEYLNALLCKFVVYSLQHSETFDISHVFLPLTIAELSTLKQVRFFWPTLYLYFCLPCLIFRGIIRKETRKKQFYFDIYWVH